MKKFTVMVLSLIMCFSVFAGCVTHPDFEEDNLPPGGTRLNVWAHNPLVYNYKSILRANKNDANAKLTETIINDFVKENPSIRINLSFHDWGENLNANLLKAIKGGEQIDVVYGETYIKAYMEGGYFAKLDTPYYKSVITDKALQYGVMNDEVYAVPAVTGSFGIIINKAVLKDAGILDANGQPKSEWADKKPLAPEYWEDLLSICEAVKAHYSGLNKPKMGGMLLASSKQDSPWRSLAVMRAAGGDFLNEQGNFALNSPENVKAFEMLRALENTSPQNSIYDDETNAQYLRFNNNEAAYLVDGIDPITRSVGMPSEGNIVISEIPRFKGMEKKANILVGSVYFSVMESSKNKEASEKFIKHMLKPQYQKEYLKVQLRLPTVDSVLKSDEIKTSEYHYDMMEPLIKPFVDTSYDFKGGIPSFEKNTSKIWDEWTGFIMKVFEENGNMQTLADSYNIRINNKKDE